jgi:hypothetical protein
MGNGKSSSNGFRHQDHVSVGASAGGSGSCFSSETSALSSAQRVTFLTDNHSCQGCDCKIHLRPAGTMGNRRPHCLFHPDFYTTPGGHIPCQERPQWRGKQLCTSLHQALQTNVSERIFRCNCSAHSNSPCPIYTLYNL